MAKKLELKKCKVVMGKKQEYPVMLLDESGRLLTSVTIYMQNGMTETQKKTITKSLKLAFDELIKNEEI